MKDKIVPRPGMGQFLLEDTIKLTTGTFDGKNDFQTAMSNPIELHLVRQNIVGFQISALQPGYTVVYTVDGNKFIVKETPDQILMLK